jgi:hypothetical protein
MTGFKDEQESLKIKSTNDGRGIAEEQTWTTALPYLGGCLGDEGSASIREPLQHRRPVPTPSPPSANFSSTHAPRLHLRTYPAPTARINCHSLPLRLIPLPAWATASSSRIGPPPPGSSGRVRNLGTSRTCSLKGTTGESQIRKPRLHTAGFFLQI